LLLSGADWVGLMQHRKRLDVDAVAIHSRQEPRAMSGPGAYFVGGGCCFMIRSMNSSNGVFFGFVAFSISANSSAGVRSGFRAIPRMSDSDGSGVGAVGGALVGILRMSASERICDGG